MVRGAAFAGALSLLSFALADGLAVSRPPVLEPGQAAADQKAKDKRRSGRGFWARYACWLLGQRVADCGGWPSERGVLAGDLGRSDASGRPFWPEFSQRLGHSLWLIGPALVAAALASLSLATLTLSRFHRLDRGLVLFAVVGSSVPSYGLGLLAVGIGSLLLGRWPATAEPSGSMFLPWTALTLFFFTSWIRVARVALRDADAHPAAETARGKGISGARLVIVHLWPLAFRPVLSAVSEAVPLLFAGAAVTESIFAYPGLARWLLDSIAERDVLTTANLLLVGTGLAWASYAGVRRVAHHPRLSAAPAP